MKKRNLTLIFLLVLSIMSTRLLGQSKLLITELVVTPTDGEYIEIYNPTGATIDLTNYYVTDATSGSNFYYNLPTGMNASSGDNFDFYARFPAGAMIAPGAYQTIALPGSDDFFTEYGQNPTYELIEDGGAADAIPDMLEAFGGSIGTSAGLSNGGEFVVLLFWDGTSDLVTDIDYAVWGDKNEAVSKTGISIDGPDAGATATAYQSDTDIVDQEVVANSAHSSGDSFARIDLTEGTQTTTGGNGVGGRDETSENFTATWSEDTATPNAGTTIQPPMPLVDCGDLFFSQYIEGSSNNKALEIYNPTSSAIDLGAGVYSVEIYRNGANSASQTISLSGTVVAGDVFVIANGSAVVAITGEADLTNSSFINFNGDDALVLKKNGNIIDVIGQVGNGTTYAENVTLNRKVTIQRGDDDETDAFDRTIEWDVSGIADFTGIGSYNNVCFTPAPTLSIAFSPNQIAAGETTTLTFTVDNSLSASPVTINAATVTAPAGLVFSGAPLSASAGCNLLTQVFTTDNFYFTGGSIPASTSCTVSILMTTANSATTGNFSVPINANSSAGTSTEATADLLVLPPVVDCGDLFFSQYIEGSSNNKAIEIFNPTSSAIDLGAGAYSIELYSNGSNSVSQSANLTGIINAGDVFVAANAGANGAITGVADLINSTVINFNGNDALVLRKNGNIIDVIGEVGNGANFADEVTLNRKVTIQRGDDDETDAFDRTIEWDVSAQDDFSGIGSYKNVCFTPAPALSMAFSPNQIVAGGTTILTFTVDNSLSVTPVNIASVTIDAPTGLVFSGTPLSSSAGCNLLGQAVTDSNFSFTSGSIPACTSCTVSILMTTANTATSGNFNVPINANSSFGASTTATANLAVFPFIADIPTLGEWGLIILALLLLNIGVLAVSVPQMQTTHGKTPFNLKWNYLPFNKSLFQQIFIIVGVTLIGIFGIATLAFQYSMTLADPFGILVTIPLVAYLISILMVAENK